MKVVSYFPRMVEVKDNEDLYRVVFLEELLVVLNTFKKDRSPGLNGWPVEFYLDFFEFLREYILRVVEEVMLLGKVLGSFNSIFIASIPKQDCSENFDGFRLISLCDCV